MELIIRSFASWSPRSMSFASSISSSAVRSGQRPASLRKSWRASVVASAEVAVEVGRGVGIDPGAVVADLDAVPLGVLVERARLVGVDVELLEHTLDLGQIEAAELFAMGDQGREPVMVKRVGHTSPPCL